MVGGDGVGAEAVEDVLGEVCVDKDLQAPVCGHGHVAGTGRRLGEGRSHVLQHGAHVTTLHGRFGVSTLCCGCRGRWTEFEAICRHNTIT